MEKTEDEIKKAILGMYAIRLRVVPFSMFGGGNLHPFDIVLNVFEERMDADDIEDKYDSVGYSEEDLMLAYHAADWIAGEDDDFNPVDNWPLKVSDK